MFDDSELRAIRGAVEDFVRSEIKRESDIFKMWERGLDLGYFNLSALKAIESSEVFSAVHEVSPEIGHKLLYLSISNHLFGDLASLAIPLGGTLITDWVQGNYVVVAADAAKLVKASSEFLTTEVSRLRSVEVLKTKKIDFGPLLNVLLASRCVGTAIHAYDLAIRYVKETGLKWNYCHIFEKLGEISAEISASKLLTRYSALRIKSEDAKRLTEMALWKAAVTAVMAVDEAVLIQEGAYKYLEDFKVGIFRDFAQIRHRSPKTASVHSLKVSELYYPKAINFSPFS